MERTTMKVNGSRPSLSSLRSSLYDSIEEMAQRDLEVSITSWAKLMSIILELQAIKELVSQRKEDIPNKGKIYMCFKFPALIRIRMIESDVEDLEERVLLMITNWRGSCISGDE
ncbi:unnamed protein product [Arabis nemorensis]|uniref:Uncharacterized protein n=1 Tax=Arabis nemorensis TaxID=586526 RepID=A0A565BX22_9BRAS|nr:unnamed protein product [Arabis nemorensis]